MKGNFGRSKSGVWLRNGMLVLQFSIATFFIIGSYIVYEQVKYLSSKDGKLLQEETIVDGGKQVKLNVPARANIVWLSK
mgnify:CR=1 FL=1